MTQSVPGASAPTNSQILDFLLEAGTWRTGLLSLLLDAVGAAMDGGSVVVLGVRDDTVARLWRGAVSMFLAPSSAEQFRWQHAEGRGSVGEEVHLVTVALTELPEWAEASTGVVIGEEDNCSLGELSVDGHQTERGTSVTVTQWSLLAEALIVDHETALAALALQEKIHQKFADESVYRLWPLAMTVASTPEMHDSMSSAANVIRAHSPKSLCGESELFNIAVGAVANVYGRESAAMWRDQMVAPTIPEPEAASTAVTSTGGVSDSEATDSVVSQSELRSLVMGEVMDLPPDALRWGCSVSWTQPAVNSLEVDVVVFLLDENRKVSSDEDFVFYNAPVGGNGAVKLSVLRPDMQRVDLDFGVLASRYHRVAMGIVITGQGSFSSLNPLRMILTDNEFPIADSVCAHATTEQAMIVGEFYTRAGRWRVRSVWQGFDGGLAELATSYGVVVDDHG